MFINPRENYWQKRYYEKLFMRMESRELKQNISKNYLEGLEWVINYYSNDCIDWTWHYKYNYPPLLQDLKKYTPRFNTTFIVNHGKNDESVSELVQLAYVLPRNSLNLLGSLEKKLVKQMPNSYLSNFKLEWAFCKYIWESHVLLPYMDIDKLKNIIKESKIKSNQTKEFFKLQ